jgi:hypothetical protein
MIESWPDISDPVAVAGPPGRALCGFPPASNENLPMDLFFAPSQIETSPIYRLRPHAGNPPCFGVVSRSVFVTFSASGSR